MKLLLLLKHLQCLLVFFKELSLRLVIHLLSEEDSNRLVVANVVEILHHLERFPSKWHHLTHRVLAQRCKGKLGTSHHLVLESFLHS